MSLSVRLSGHLRTAAAIAAGSVLFVSACVFVVRVSREASAKTDAAIARKEAELAVARGLAMREAEIAAAYAKENAAERKESGGDVLKRTEAIAVKAGAAVKDLRKNDDGTVTLDAEMAPDAVTALLFALKDAGVCKALLAVDIIPAPEAKGVRVLLRMASHGSGDVL